MSMEFEEKIDRAFKELSETTMKKYNYAPPYINILRRFGLDLKPPHYNTYIANVLVLGLVFSIVFSVLTFLSAWYRGTLDSYSLISVVIPGTLFGLLMAAFVDSGKKKHNLSSWEDL